LSSGEGIVRNRFAKGGRFETSLPLNYGDSGSPVFDIAGCVVGMAEGGYDDANLITYMIPSDFLGPLVSLTGQNIGAEQETRPLLAPTPPTPVPFHIRLRSSLRIKESSSRLFASVRASTSSMFMFL
jgi:hypothetical protein